MTLGAERSGMTNAGRDEAPSGGPRPYDPHMTEKPQPWDPVKVAQAVADARELIETLALQSGRGGKYAEKLGDIMDVRLSLNNVTDVKELRDRLSYVLYGFAMYGVTATAMAGPAAESIGATADRITAAVDDWLKANS
jgi:hypothetical protein